MLLQMKGAMAHMVYVRVADLPGFAGTNRLVVPPFKLSTIGSRAFQVAGPQVWNSLPEDVTSAPTLSTFR